jgi:hypothetical protein
MSQHKYFIASQLWSWETQACSRPRPMRSSGLVSFATSMPALALPGRGGTLVSEVGILLLRSTCNPDARPLAANRRAPKGQQVVHGWLRGKTVHRSGAGLGGARLLRVNFSLLFLGYRLGGLEAFVMLFIWKYCFRIFEPYVGEITTRDLVGTGSSHVCCTAAKKHSPEQANVKSGPTSRVAPRRRSSSQYLYCCLKIPY